MKKINLTCKDRRSSLFLKTVGISLGRTNVNCVYRITVQAFAFHGEIGSCALQACYRNRVL